VVNESQEISVKGARTNNLKGIDVSFPKGKLTLVTGVSGSGKSSLVFSTLYAEGQRRYVESFSTYARQFLERMDRPDVDAIDGLLPAVAIEQRNTIRSARSTLASLTELTEYIKLLYANLSECHCSECGEVVRLDESDQVARSLLKEQEGTRLMVAFPFHLGHGDDRDIALGYLAHEGFHRAIVEGKVVDLEELTDEGDSATDIVVDRLKITEASHQRLIEAFELAYRMGESEASLWLETDDGFEQRSIYKDLRHCGKKFSAPRAGHFSFNSPLGACEACNGFGRIMDYDIDRIIPNRSLSLKKKAIRPWGAPKKARERRYLKETCERLGIDMETPFNELSEEEQRLLIDGEEGTGSRNRWVGVKGWFKWLERKTYKMHVRVLLARYRAYIPCLDCDATRLKPHSLLFRLGEKNVAELLSCSVSEARVWLESIRPQLTDRSVSNIAEQVESRLRYLEWVGLGYLGLNRQSRTLSGGEVQRAHLTNALGSGLVNTLFVLDEPSIGLHAHDANRLASFMSELVAHENTVVVVEHDPELLAHADHVIELGPGPGEAGGQLIYTGPPSGLLQEEKAATTQALRSVQNVVLAHKDCSKGKALRIRGAKAHNLKNIDVSLPFGQLTVISGVSGSGKSTLIDQVLYRGILRKRGEVTDPPGEHDAIEGLESVDEVIWVDQSAPSSNSRANPATYVKAWDAVRKLFEKTELAKERRYTSATFSFNSGTGRCATCQGAGLERVEMQFLSDVYLTCQVCEGKRFTQEVLEIQVNALSISDVLDLTIVQAQEFLGPKSPGGKRLTSLIDVGLGYLRMGQSLNTLSGGEAQRLKLAHHLGKAKTKKALFLLDEPTTGLHLKDVEVLVKNLKRLRDAGNTMVVIEHHLDVIAAADHVIDLGPGGGDHGGELAFAGPPSALVSTETRTGIHLRNHIELRQKGTLFHPKTTQATSQETPRTEDTGVISIEGARVHNLKNISLRIPRSGRTVITGVSGSGKSSLAFDLVFAEGQRRFLDCLSSYARQYINQLEKPDADRIWGIPPTVAIEQRRTRGNPHSTVADVTELASFLRLLFARCGVDPGGQGGAWKPAKLAEFLMEKGKPVHEILAPAVRLRKGYHRAVFARAASLGHATIRVNGEFVAVDPPTKLHKRKRHTLEFHLGNSGGSDASKLRNIIEEAARLGEGQVTILHGEKSATYDVDVHSDSHFRRSEFDPRLFSAHSHVGSCPECSGAGVDEEEEVCLFCDGERLSDQGRRILVGGKRFPDLLAMNPETLRQTLKDMALGEREARIAKGPIDALTERLEFLQEVGLNYLTLARRVGTLSGGEFQRIRLASQLGARLSGVLYVLDEPSIGLHPTDVDRLLDCLTRLEALGNGILMVEHDESTIRWADRLIDIGPGAGTEGGEIMISGSVDEVLLDERSLTGRCLAQKKVKVRSSPRPLEDVVYMELKGIQHHNISGANVQVPRSRLTAITGVSGSGKSTLVKDVLVEALNPGKGKGTFVSSQGFDGLKRTIFVDDKPIGKNPRSTPSTYVGLFGPIRQLFARVPEARLRGYKANRFSFNVKGGRCEECGGQGRIKLEMSFLPNSYVTCETCNGKRFNRQTLQVSWNGHNIHEVLQLSVNEALNLFENVPSIRRTLELMEEVGLGYLSLGQSSTTLSGGEAQRIKLVSELKGNKREDTVVILDEPTTGLHLADVPRLIRILHRLVDRGATVVVIEHHSDVIAEADWVIDMGPGPGMEGGQVVYQGKVSGLLKSKTSLTGKAMKTRRRRSPSSTQKVAVTAIP
jgi:excinuclease ABC subunit A